MKALIWLWLRDGTHTSGPRGSVASMEIQCALLRFAASFVGPPHFLMSLKSYGPAAALQSAHATVPALAGLTGTPEAFAEDIGLLSAIEADLTLAKAPFLSDIWDEYDLDRSLHDPSSAATGRITAGLQATEVRLNQENRDAPLHVGAATAKRSFLAHHRLLSDTLRGDTGRQLSGVDGRKSEERRERESLLTNKVLYKGTVSGLNPRQMMVTPPR